MHESKKTNIDRVDSSKSENDFRDRRCRPRRRVLIPVKRTYEQSMGRALADLMVDREPVKILNMQTGRISCYSSADMPLCAGEVGLKPESAEPASSLRDALKTGAK
ncbi:hypothetical protein CAFE_17240 [Caprobacter fermentans]|uniref:Uncharacterized protein n=1 Tax=Caproicibacter fermentans TaxID=2576756 RepID=A0A6N8HZ26_9FIRM|nr:hypothetical protein [Caproicibacter fermentans]MVB11022.1 hypothetical protein [Caproicibacter fermentans]OCN01719.1 hypothetical protein A7X67_01115 [Clostridium sp. W14A]QNK39364.1 hypothetical protein HCR03_11425 [Caproicibacter fermentans]